MVLITYLLPILFVEGAMLLLAITVQQGMYSRLIDIDSAFSIAENKQDVFMKFPDGMAAIPGKACNLLISSTEPNKSPMTGISSHTRH
jgi:hypothetical protein